MNCTQAKQIDLLNFMRINGFEVTNKRNNQAWFLSPFRREKTPSFKIDISRNIWYDFGEGCGGTIIDFVMKLNHCNTQKALEILSEKSFSFHQQKVTESKPSYKILSIKKITNYNLKNYLESRKIDLEIAQRFCSEIHYTFDDNKRFYGIGFKNNSNGFEIRNKFFKGCLGSKDITSFYTNSTTISIFESWSDFLSYLTLKNKMIDESFIILNSTAMIKRINSEINNFKKVKTFFDNDDAGEKAYQYLRQKTTKSKLIDCRIHYKKHKDLNEYLMSLSG